MKKTRHLTSIIPSNCQIYGQTEIVGIAYMHRDGDVRPDTVGKPIPGTECKISDAGEILSKSLSVTQGYYKLPDKTEVAALLIDVSQTGLAAGLEFQLFQPSGEQNRDFYAELPIRVRVNGKYHEFGRFISGLAALPRIVTIHEAPAARGSRNRVVPRKF